MIEPAVSSAEFIEADFARPVSPIGKIRYNQSKVPQLRHHRIGLIDPALTVATGMGMNVRHDIKLSRATPCPDLIHMRSVEDDHALQAIRVDIVIGKKLENLPRHPRLLTEQKATTFLVAPAPTSQLKQNLLPELPPAGKPRLRSLCKKHIANRGEDHRRPRDSW